MALTTNYTAIAARKPKGPTKKKNVWRKPVKRSERVQFVALGVDQEHFKISRDASDVEQGPLKIASGGLPSLGKKR